MSDMSASDRDSGREPELAEEQLLLEYLSEALSPAAREVLAARLVAEPGLAERLALLEVEQEVLQSALGPDLEHEGGLEDNPPAQLAERILSALAEAPQTSTPAPLRLVPARGLRWRPLLAAAALLTGALLALQLTRGESPHQTIRRQVRTSELLALGISTEERS